MSIKVGNREKLEEARKLLAEVFLEEYGEKFSPKFISFEFLSSQKLEKDGRTPSEVKISSKVFHVTEMPTLKLPVVVDSVGRRVS